jgi:hypothetical protein
MCFESQEKMLIFLAKARHLERLDYHWQMT